ncbi:MAG: hypothetical protein AAF490_18585 [Chloroflexota bacterium]
MSEINIDDGDLMAYLAGEASSDISKAIESSKTTLAEIEALRSLDVSLLSLVFRSNCPDTKQLLEYQIGFLPNELQAETEAHISDCPHCRAEIDKITAEEFENQKVVVSSGLGAKIDQLIAAGKTILHTKLIPSPPQPAFALRGNQLSVKTYKANEFQIVLSIQQPIASEKNAKVEGQLTNLEDPLAEFRGKITLYQDNDVIKVEPLDIFGYFSFGNIEFGTYDLLVELDNKTITVSEIQVAN